MANKKSTATGSRSDAIRAYLKSHPDASQKDIAAGLAAEGVEASVSLINKIKYGKPTGKRPGKKKAGRAAAHRNGKPTKAKAVASKSGTSKAQAIRDAMDKLGHRTRPRNIIAHLYEQGVKVAAAQVSSPQGAGQAQAAGGHGNRSGGAHPRPGTVLEHLVAAKKLTDQVGLQQARKALEILAKLGAHEGRVRRWHPGPRSGVAGGPFTERSASQGDCRPPPGKGFLPVALELRRALGRVFQAVEHLDGHPGVAQSAHPQHEILDRQHLIVVQLIEVGRQDCFHVGCGHVVDGEVIAHGLHPPLCQARTTGPRKQPSRRITNRRATQGN